MARPGIASVPELSGRSTRFGRRSEHLPSRDSLRQADGIQLSASAASRSWRTQSWHGSVPPDKGATGRTLDPFLTLLGGPCRAGTGTELAASPSSVGARPNAAGGCYCSRMKESSALTRSLYDQLAERPAPGPTATQTNVTR